MLSELSGLQSSDEETWGCPELSFTIDTRASDSDELIERKYTFSYAKEWDAWTFVEFEEKRAGADRRVANRNWSRTRHIMWGENDEADVSVPPEVTKKLEEMLDVDSIVINR